MGPKQPAVFDNDAAVGAPHASTIGLSRAGAPVLADRPAAKPRPPSIAVTRRALRTGRFAFVAKRIVRGRGKGDRRKPATEPVPPSRWTGREILAEMILPLFGLAVVVGIAVFWAEP